MSDALLPYYDRELNAIRALAAEFAEANPKIAGRLRLSADAVDDPHVARLLEGVAFLAARVHHRLDDEFPELTDALLGVLYPHYLAPVPSCAIAQFTCLPELQVPARIPPGLPLDTEPVRGETCRFRTAYPVTLWPIEIESVRLSGLPLAAPANPRAVGAVGVLRIGLKCASAEASFTQLGVDRLRFFLRAAANISLPLFELLCRHAVGIALADGPNDPAPVLVPPTAIEPVGFGAGGGAAALAGAQLLRLPAADRIFRVSREIPVPRFRAGSRARHWFPAATGWRSSSISTARMPELERAIGADALATRLHAHRQPVPATLRAGAAEPHRDRVPRRAGRAAHRGAGGLER